MTPKCKLAVEEAAKALGRARPGKAQLQAIEDQLSAELRHLAGTVEGWGGLTKNQQMTAAAKSLMQDIKAEAKRKVENAERQILRQAESGERIRLLQESYKDTPGHNGLLGEATKRDYELTHSDIAAERKMTFGKLTSLIEAAGSKKDVGWGRRILMTVFDAENPKMTRDIVKEIFKNADGHTKNEPAKIAARAWLDTVEEMRTRFNNAGGDVGKLLYGFVPQPHDIARIRKAGVDAWVQKVAPLLDRKRYLNEDGSRMDSARLTTFLREAYGTLSTGGILKHEPGTYQGTGARANKGADSRQIHFADGDAWAEYMKDFGKGTVYDAMMGHIGGMTRDIGLVEHYGPDANATARLLNDTVRQQDGAAAEKVFSILPETYWDMISGKTGTPVNSALSNTMTNIRNMNTAKLLGAAVISSVDDLRTIVHTTGYNKLPYWQLVKDIGSQSSKETRDWMSAHGMIAESLADAINRWSGDHIGSNWSGKIANGVLRASLLTAWTDGLRQGFTMSMNAGLARMARKDWGSLAGFDRSRLTRSGITEADWGVLNGVQAEQFKGRELLTPQSILASGHEDAQSIAAKVFGFIHDESEFAVVNPDLTARAIQTWGRHGQAGTPVGEIARQIMQFKSFPITMVTRHWARMLEGDHGQDGAPLAANRMAYSMSLLVGATAMGAIATQAKQILDGKDPIDMEKGRFWAKAMAQGGGLSIVGDLVLVDPQNSSIDTATTAVKNIAGPTIGNVAELGMNLIVQNAWEASQGKDTKWEAELFNWSRQQVPGQNLWWLKPAINHGFANAMNENLSPGYLSRVQQRGMKDYGQKYWWAPRDSTPARAPDLSAALP